MGCFRYIIVITLHKGDNKYDNNKEEGMYREQVHLVPGGGEIYGFEGSETIPYSRHSGEGGL